MTGTRSRRGLGRWLLVLVLVLGVAVMHSVAAHHGASDSDHRGVSGVVADHDAEPAAGGESGTVFRSPGVIVADSPGAAVSVVPLVGMSSAVREVVTPGPAVEADPDATGLALAVLIQLLLLVGASWVWRSRTDLSTARSAGYSDRQGPGPPGPLATTAVCLDRLQVRRI